jgi:hypothetical protein
MAAIIEVFVLTEHEPEPRKMSLDTDRTVELLIREFFPDRHEEFDLFNEREEHPLRRVHRISETSVKHGHRLHFRKRHNGNEHHHHGLPQHPKLLLDTKDGIKEFTAPKNPMTGAELRGLFSVAADYDLWTKIPGKDDLRIEPGMCVELKECEHFYTAPGTLNPGSR